MTVYLLVSAQKKFPTGEVVEASNRVGNGKGIFLPSLLGNLGSIMGPKIYYGVQAKMNFVHCSLTKNFWSSSGCNVDFPPAP